jgi:hypothetical protein
MPWWAGLWLLLMLAPAGAEAAPVRASIDDTSIRVVTEGLELVVRRHAPVAFTGLADLAREIERALPEASTAMRLTRGSPPRTIDYVLGVTPDGVLVVGQQTRLYDFGKREYVLWRGEVARGYQPLERADAWAWLVDLPLNREVSVTLEMSALREAWPVEHVRIALVRVSP